MCWSIKREIICGNSWAEHMISKAQVKFRCQVEECEAFGSLESYKQLLQATLLPRPLSLRRPILTNCSSVRKGRISRLWLFMRWGRGYPGWYLWFMRKHWMDSQRFPVSLAKFCKEIWISLSQKDSTRRLSHLPSLWLTPAWSLAPQMVPWAVSQVTTTEHHWTWSMNKTKIKQAVLGSWCGN